MLSPHQRLTQGQPVLITRTLVVDGLSPVSLFHPFAQAHEYAFLLESVTGGDTRGRYSVIALNPDIIWQCKDGKATLTQNGQTTPISAPPLESLQTLINQNQMQIDESLPPMVAGLIGMMGYEMIREVEHLPSDKEGPSNLPDGCFMRPQMSLVHDNVSDALTLATPIWTKDEKFSATQADEAIASATERLNEMQKLLIKTRSLPPVNVSTDKALNSLSFTGNMTADNFKAIVTRAKEYILSGEIFQIVPSMRFTARFTAQPMAFYRALRHLNPSPYMFYLKLNAATIIGASPEILVRVRDGEVTIRPLAGTRKRGATFAEDNALEQDLLADTKEIAEHLMLLDLGRNDVGRVTQSGTVKVTEQMKIERYSHVMHIVSNVVGKIKQGTSSLTALMAGFPAGTVTGAPKIRAMEILDELEPQRRGFYGGCVGYFSTQGEMDSCITLRTALIKEGQLHLQAGAGVVADSIPQNEYEEVCNKAKALMRAAEITSQFEVHDA